MIVLSFCTHIFRVYILGGRILGVCNISCCRLVDRVSQNSWKCASGKSVKQKMSYTKIIIIWAGLMENINYVTDDVIMNINNYPDKYQAKPFYNHTNTCTKVSQFSLPAIILFSLRVQ